MPDDRTEATEIATALGMLGYQGLIAAVEARPSELVNVAAATWDRLTEIIRSGRHRSLAESAFENGVVFAASSDGLRGRRSLRVGWKEPHRPPGYELLPADLRINTYRGDCVLDPFAGGAQTSLACLVTGRHYVGVDVDRSYIQLGERRIAEYSHARPDAVAVAG